MWVSVYRAWIDDHSSSMLTWELHCGVPSSYTRHCNDQPGDVLHCDRDGPSNGNLLYIDPYDYGLNCAYPSNDALCCNDPQDGSLLVEDPWSDDCLSATDAFQSDVSFVRNWDDDIRDAAPRGVLVRDAEGDDRATT